MLSCENYVRIRGGACNSGLNRVSLKAGIVGLALLEDQNAWCERQLLLDLDYLR